MEQSELISQSKLLLLMNSEFWKRQFSHDLFSAVNTLYVPHTNNKGIVESCYAYVSDTCKSGHNDLGLTTLLCCNGPARSIYRRCNLIFHPLVI